MKVYIVYDDSIGGKIVVGVRWTKRKAKEQKKEIDSTFEIEEWEVQ